MRELARYLRLHLWLLPRIHRSYKNLSTEEAFNRIYETRAWGGDSGSGSGGFVAEQYIEDVAGFIADRKIKSVVDLGCGDFRIGRALVERTGINYTGIDIVPSLIQHHIEQFSAPNISFVRANMLTDSLPMADLCLVRQVFQHLSNN